MPEQPMNGNRMQAWLDTLSRDELFEVQRLQDMPTDMRLLYIYIDFKRQIAGKRSTWQHVGAGLSGGFIAVAAMFAHAMGWTERIR